MKSVNPSALWRKIDEKYWQFYSPGYAVYGVARIYDDRPEGKAEWYWEARVMMDCDLDSTHRPIRGFAHTLESAQKIVEVLCWETLTCEKA